jgi:hypothetical protein
MTVSLHEGRPPRVSGRTRARPGSGPSVREVCLIGLVADWSEGDRVTWSGRVYRVEATRPRADGPAAYAHLAPAR